MVNVVFTVVSMAVLVFAVASRSSNNLLDDTSEVLSANMQVTESPVATPTETDEPTPSPVSTTASTPLAFQTPSQTTQPSPNANPVVSLAINDWTYQPSEVISQSSSEVIFKTSSNAKDVTAWYRAKFTSLGYRATSVIQTQSNEKVLNKLAASSGSVSVSIEISQENASAPILVKVTISGSNASI